MVLRDGRSTSVLAIQLKVQQPNTGQFDFYIPGQGDYTGVIPVQIMGPDIVRLQGTISAQFQTITAAPASQVNLRMEGEANTRTASAAVNIWIDGAQYQIVTAPGRPGADVALASTVIAALVASDWSTLYGLLASDVKGSLSEAEFISIMTSQVRQTITKANLLPGGALTASETGSTYSIQPIEFEVRNTDGIPQLYRSRIYLLLQQGEWRYVTTDEPVAV